MKYEPSRVPNKVVELNCRMVGYCFFFGLIFMFKPKVELVELSSLMSTSSKINPKKGGTKAPPCWAQCEGPNSIHLGPPNLQDCRALQSLN